MKMAIIGNTVTNVSSGNFLLIREKYGEKEKRLFNKLLE